MGQWLLMAGACAVLFAVPVRLVAHHSLTAEYDADAPVTLRGTIVKAEWLNPHAFLSIAVTTPDGKTETWRVITGLRAKDRTPRAFGRRLALPDGRFFNLSNAREAPRRVARSKPQRQDSTLLYVLIVPGLVLTTGLYLLWRGPIRR